MMMVMMTTTMFFFQKAPTYQSKKYATNSCNPKEENNTKQKTKKKTRKQSYIVCSQNRSLNKKWNGERMMGGVEIEPTLQGRIEEAKVSKAEIGSGMEHCSRAEA
jgi:hypothetical protein